ncbi:hypothetical protein [Marinibactrum halimedae]|nr:hypothetical protein [Marinibactrum halimedae]MCD9460831.1 hypothetical protein [Marinibactrum halimedae]
MEPLRCCNDGVIVFGVVAEVLIAVEALKDETRAFFGLFYIELNIN